MERISFFFFLSISFARQIFSTVKMEEERFLSNDSAGT